MTDEQINQRIAETAKYYENTHYPDIKRIPNFCADLNAMHQAEKNLVGGISAEYAEHLLEVTGRNWSDDIQFFCATARQRAEAFLRTLGKWEEEA